MPSVLASARSTLIGRGVLTGLSAPAGMAPVQPAQAALGWFTDRDSGTVRKTVGAPGVAGRRFQDVSKNGDELPAHAAGQELCLRAADRS